MYSGWSFWRVSQTPLHPLMIIPAPRLLDHLIPGSVLEVRRPHPDNRLYKTAGWDEALSMIAAGTVEGVAHPSGRVRFLRLVVPVEQVSVARQPVESAVGVITQASREVYRQWLGDGENYTARVWALKALKAEGL